MTNKVTRRWLLPLLVVWLGLLAFSGCESDTTAPQDELPPLGNEGIANQAAALSYLMNQVWDAINAAQKEIVPGIINVGDIHGSYTMDYRCKEPDETLVDCPRDSSGVNYMRVWTDQTTDPPQDIQVYEGTDPTLATLTFDVIVDPFDNTEGSENGTVNGAGDIQIGTYPGHFTIENIGYARGSYPGAGVLTYAVGEDDAMVQFTGGRCAEINVNGGAAVYHVDLDTGELEDPCPPVPPKWH